MHATELACHAMLSWDFLYEAAQMGWLSCHIRWMMDRGRQSLHVRARTRCEDAWMLANICRQDHPQNPSLNSIQNLKWSQPLGKERKRKWFVDICIAWRRSTTYHSFARLISCWCRRDVASCLPRSHRLRNCGGSGRVRLAGRSSQRGQWQLSRRELSLVRVCVL